jgi:hypothetical protein
MVQLVRESDWLEGQEFKFSMLKLHLELKTDRFKLTGSVRRRANSSVHASVASGNEFYGEDFAEWLCSKLSRWHFRVTGEDWGWLVFSMPANAEKHGLRHRISIYAHPRPNQVDDFGRWCLYVTSEIRVKRLGFLKSWETDHYNRLLANDLQSALQELVAEDVLVEEVNE